MRKLQSQMLIVDALHPMVDNSGVSLGDIIVYSDLTKYKEPYGIGFADGTIPDLSNYWYGPAVMQNGNFVEFGAVDVKILFDRQAAIAILNEILVLLANMTGNAVARQSCADKVNTLKTAIQRGYA